MSAFGVDHDQLKGDEILTGRTISPVTVQPGPWGSSMGRFGGLSKRLPCSHLDCYNLTVCKSLAGRKVAVFCQAGIEILEKLLQFSDLITVNYNNFAWK